MKKIKYLLILLCNLHLISYSFGLNFNINIHSQEITLNQLLNYKKQYLSVDSLISTEKLEEFKQKIQSHTCYYYYKDNYIYIKPICFLQNNLPKFGFKETVEMSLPYITEFKNTYDEKSIYFSYQNTIPILNKKYKKLSSLIGNSKIDQALLTIMEYYNIRIKLLNIYFLLDNLKNYGFYVVSKDLSQRQGCRKSNYESAIQLLDKKFLQPEEKINFNYELINNKNGYCKGHTDKVYMFYGGVCGAATQLFRMSLINPYLYVTKRSNHGERFVNYYSDYIYGDDASVYELTKQFEIKNIGAYPVYFRLIKKNNYSILINIVPEKNKYFNTVLKMNFIENNSFVSKSVIESDTGKRRYEQYWYSKYINKNYSS